MGTYSVAIIKNRLSSLIDKALAGEEVIITRHGLAVVQMHTVNAERVDNRDAAEELRRLRGALPRRGICSAELIREMRD